MKNLKKLNRNELKTIAGGALLDNIVDGTVNSVQNLGFFVQAIVTGQGSLLCNVQCIVNGIVEIKVLSCGSTC